MRSWAFSALLACSVGCATGAAVDDDSEDTPSKTDDAGGAQDAGSSTQNDSGTTFADDANTTTQQDGGTITLDSGVNNACSAYQGTLVTFDFTGEPGNQTSTAAKSAASGVTATAISRASALTATSGQDSINASEWSTSKLDATRYYTFTLTPAAPCALDVTSLSITTKTSATGPADVSVATSDDDFAQTTSVTPNATATPALSVNGASGAVEIRVYGYDASGAGGTLRIESTLTATGALH